MVKLDNMSNLKDKNILVGVTGSISIYKSCDLIRTLIKEGANVTVVMTSNAEKFISPMTFQSISGRKVFTNMYDTDESSLAHINRADNSDLIIVCPATANFVSKYANGIADNLLLNILLATKSKVVVCPAMNVNMFENPLVQENIIRLSKLGIDFVEPDSGDLLCGWEGKGRLADLNKILMAIKTCWYWLSCCQISSCLEASSTTQFSMAKIIPVSSARNKNSLGVSRPFFGCCQRNRASKPMVLALSKSEIF